MGRNNDTFTLVIDKNRDAWSKFRRGLRKEDQQLFDELWRAPKLHLAAGAFIANEVPMETILMAMMLEMYKKMKLLENKLGIGKMKSVSCEWKNGLLEEQSDQPISVAGDEFRA
ncbi:MAG: hypothetical protein HZB59_02080 [Ignavibacteriales bacterium]|nr:hypothetical protein [Ignavibacteriales bacterium]